MARQAIDAGLPIIEHRQSEESREVSDADRQATVLDAIAMAKNATRHADEETVIAYLEEAYRLAAEHDGESISYMRL